mgnify:CR=1 FL=1
MWQVRRDSIQLYGAICVVFIFFLFPFFLFSTFVWLNLVVAYFSLLPVRNDNFPTVLLYLFVIDRESDSFRPVRVVSCLQIGVLGPEDGLQTDCGHSHTHRRDQTV